jgi:arylsulfatase A-like enzyme/Tfp pilus assembly protein PilF
VRRARLLAGAALAAACLACRQPSNLLVVTWDTTRADALAPYGNRRAATPAAASLAERGVVFERALAVAPLTLPSHASLFTGTYPPHHGIRDNGSARLPQAAVTLAELLRERGYRTGAFVGAYVVDARWGLDQGFDAYSGSFADETRDVFSLGDVSRTADRVAGEALGWLAQESDDPFFAWVHFYDPHAPYTPPAPFADRFAAEPYLGEVAFADSQLARLLAWLEASGTAPRTVVVLAGDHGEGFGEHGEEGHGLLLHDEALRVPLVVVAPGAARPGTRRGEAVSLVDVLPTLVELLDLSPPPWVHGRSLLPLLRGDEDVAPAPAVYAETLYPRLRFGWSDLVALEREGRRLVVAGRQAELYDLAADPAEARDLARGRPAVTAGDVRRLQALRRELERGALEPEAISEPEAAAKLAALGYLGSGPGLEPSAGGALPHPRTKLEVFRRLAEARGALAAGDPDRAAQELSLLVADEPGLIDAQVGLGEARLRLGDPAGAAAAFGQAMRMRPSDPTLLGALATAELEAGSATEAKRLLAAAVELDPRESRFRFLLGRAHLALGDPAGAELAFAAALELNPRSAHALVELAGTALARGDLEAAVEQARRALELLPHVPGAHLGLALVHQRRDELEAAWREGLVELTVQPGARVLSLLGELAPRLGRGGELEEALRESIRRHPRATGNRLMLARLLLARGVHYEEAVAITEDALRLGLAGRDRTLAYYLLADLHNRLGDQEASDAYARGRVPPPRPDRRATGATPPPW